MTHALNGIDGVTSLPMLQSSPVSTTYFLKSLLKRRFCYFSRQHFKANSKNILTEIFHPNTRGQKSITALFGEKETSELQNFCLK